MRLDELFILRYTCIHVDTTNHVTETVVVCSFRHFYDYSYICVSMFMCKETSQVKTFIFEEYPLKVSQTKITRSD